MKSKFFIDKDDRGISDDFIKELKQKGWKDFDEKFIIKSLKSKKYDKNFYKQSGIDFLYKELELPGILSIGTFIESSVDFCYEIRHITYNVDFEEMFYILDASD